MKEELIRQITEEVLRQIGMAGGMRLSAGGQRQKNCLPSAVPSVFRKSFRRVTLSVI